MAGSSALSDDEFQRLQSQLIELRTSNYHLSEECTKYEKVSKDLTQNVDSLSKDLEKATKVISKSKKAKEVEQMFQENDNLQRKLLSQEEDFNIQNQTLMQELGRLVSVNEELEKEVLQLKEGSTQNTTNGKISENVEDELRHLQAQNAVLQKNLNAQKENESEQVIELKRTIHELEVQCMKLAGQRSGPIGGASSERTVEGQSDPDDSTEVMKEHKDEVQEVQAEEMELKHSSHTENENITEIKLLLETEKEEKKILKSEIQSLEEKYKEEVKSIQNELEKVSEKFKRKQESYVNLQEEKEVLYTDLSSKLENITKARESEVDVLNGQVRKLKQQLAESNQNLEDFKAKAGKRIRELEHDTANLQSKLDEASEESKQELKEQHDQIQTKKKKVPTATLR